MRAPGNEEPSWIFATSGDEQLDAMGTWIWDLTADAVTCSDEAAAIAGLAAGQLDGDMSSFASRFTPPCRRAFRAAVTEAVRQALPFRTWLELRRADGGATLVRMSGRPFRDTDGHTVWVVGTLSEVFADACADTSDSVTTGNDDLRGAGDETAKWAEPNDRRSAVAAYRHVSELIQ